MYEVLNVLNLFLRNFVTMIQGDSSLLISTYQKNLLEQVRKFFATFLWKEITLIPVVYPVYFSIKLFLLQLGKIRISPWKTGGENRWNLGKNHNYQGSSNPGTSQTRDLTFGFKDTCFREVIRYLEKLFF